jgi:hypothetical protein
MNILLSLQFVSVAMRFLREIMETQKNVFIKSAELGVPFGAILLIASVAMLFSDKMPLLSSLTFLVAIVAPFVLYFFQRKRYVESNGFAPYSELWTLGIFTTIGGALICGLVTYLLITYLRPDFVYEQAQYVADTYRQLPKESSGSELADILEKAIKNNLLPTPFDFCAQMFWLTSSLGCVGGAITALIACKIPLKKENNQPVE